MLHLLYVKMSLSVAYISKALCAVTACLEDKPPYNIYYSYRSLVRLLAGYTLPAETLQNNHRANHPMEITVNNCPCVTFH